MVLLSVAQFLAVAGSALGAIVLAIAADLLLAIRRACSIPASRCGWRRCVDVLCRGPVLFPVPVSIIAVVWRCCWLLGPRCCLKGAASTARCCCGVGDHRWISRAARTRRLWSLTTGAQARRGHCIDFEHTHILQPVVPGDDAGRRHPVLVRRPHARLSQGDVRDVRAGALRLLRGALLPVARLSVLLGVVQGFGRNSS